MGENTDSIFLWENATVENLFFCDSSFNRAMDFSQNVLEQGPEWLWDCHPCRYWNLSWTWPWANTCNWTCSEQGVRLELLRANLHYSVFCDAEDGKRLAMTQENESLRKIFPPISLSSPQKIMKCEPLNFKNLKIFHSSASSGRRVVGSFDLLFNTDFFLFSSTSNSSS